MRYKQGHKEESHARILAAVGRGFRKRGYAGIGVDGLAKEAGVTSGAFYSHFSSKDVAFNEAVIAGLVELGDGIRALKAQHANLWLPAFIEFYTTTRLTCDLSEGCGLQTLTGEVTRADTNTRSLYESALQTVVDEVASGFSSGDNAERHALAYALLGLLSGGVTMARSIASTSLSETIGSSVRNAALTLVAAQLPKP